jgi:hypothetical protein
MTWERRRALAITHIPAGVMSAGPSEYRSGEQRRGMKEPDVY